MNIIEIRQPKWSTNEVMPAVYKVVDGWNYIRFTHAPTYMTNADGEELLYRFKGTYAKENCKVGTNGRIPCYYVPLVACETVTTKSVREAELRAERKARELREAEAKNAERNRERNKELLADILAEMRRG